MWKIGMQKSLKIQLWIYIIINNYQADWQVEDATSVLTGVYCFIAVEIVMKERLKKKKAVKVEIYSKIKLSSASFKGKWNAALGLDKWVGLVVRREAQVPEQR